LAFEVAIPRERAGDLVDAPRHHLGSFVILPLGPTDVAPSGRAFEFETRNSCEGSGDFIDALSCDLARVRITG
jgi:hypothetical protein